MLPRLNQEIAFEDLYDHLDKIQSSFLNYLEQKEEALFERLLVYYEHAEREESAPHTKELSFFILKLAPHVETFVSTLFEIEEDLLERRKTYKTLSGHFEIKRQFIQRYAIKKHPFLADDPFPSYLEATFELLLSYKKVTTDTLDTCFIRAHDALQNHSDRLEELAQYAAFATLTKIGQKRHKGTLLFKVPQKVDPLHLIPHLQKEDQGVFLKSEEMEPREGFKLTDPGFSREKALFEAHYCIKCHVQEKDSCSRGLFKKPTAQENGENEDIFAKNFFAHSLSGCPLDEKISEMNVLKQEGYDIAALLVAMIDNPMLASTGHRICNDCMASCIFQKQEPVNIPAIESNILKEILSLPYGFEIYSLFTRWNPLNFKYPVPKEARGARVMVVGLGPSGFTLAHYLLQAGLTVFGIDGLKIEPLPRELIDRSEDGRILFKPIKNLSSLLKTLDERVIEGFGGVVEYGITVRFDKNLLFVIRLLLERRALFNVQGGVRFGGTITVNQAFDMGFHHVSLCMGAGRPQLLAIPNSLAAGIRQASDFLMNLQLGGAFKKETHTSLDIDLPAVVIGGGLTAIDTATEVLAYYPHQLANFYKHYMELVQKSTEEKVLASFSPKDRRRLQRWITHHRLLQAEDDFKKRLLLLQSFGGVTVLYRRGLIDAPSYTLNATEVAHALKEGIWFKEHAAPIGFSQNEFNEVTHVHVQILANGKIEEQWIPAKSVFVAAGTKPNTSLRHDIPEEVGLFRGQFNFMDENGDPCMPPKNHKDSKIPFLVRLESNFKAVSVFGDQHPTFQGNVVKAMASAKKGAPLVERLVQKALQNKVC